MTAGPPVVQPPADGENTLERLQRVDDLWHAGVITEGERDA